MTFSPLKISLYIPAYNAANYLDRVLSSVNLLTLQPDEVIIINDGSTDSSLKIAQSFNVKIINQERNLGLAEARNRALAVCKNDLIACIDSDVIVEPEWLSKLVEFMGKNQNISAVGGRLDELHHEQLADRWRKVHMPQHWGDEDRFDIPFVFGANGLYKKEALLKIGGFNPLFKTNGEDSNICRRLIEGGCKIAYTPDAQCWHLKKDSVASVLKAYWKWMRHPICIDRPIDTWLSFFRFSRRRIAHNFSTNFLPDLKQGEIGFLLVDLILFFYAFMMELRAFIQKLHSKKLMQTSSLKNRI